jgi:hypothetical protein
MSSIPATSGPSRTRTPFQMVRVDVALAVPFALASVAWSLSDQLPGGRWLAVHLFTLGVLTPMIVAFGQHQATTLLRAEAAGSRATQRLAIVGGATLTAAGMATATSPAGPLLVAGGGMVTAGGVAAAGLRLHRVRRQAARDEGPRTRFGWLIRTYVAAHVAFLAGALLGALAGARVVPAWAYFATRQAHLTAMVVGFAAVTLLATLSLFGPMLLRAQFEPGAEAAAARSSRVAVVAAWFAVVGLLGAAAPAPADAAARWLAAAALITVGVAGAVIVAPLVRTAARKGTRAPLAGVLLTCAGGWLIASLTAGGVVVASGRWPYLDVIGGVALIGAFAQAIVATLLHVVTMWLPRRRRLDVLQRIDAIPLWSAALPQLLIAWLAIALAT